MLAPRYIMNEPFVDTAGPSLGSLAVLVRGVGEAAAGTPAQAVWRLYNNQGPDWKYAQVSITDPRDVTVHRQPKIDNLQTTTKKQKIENVSDI